jgi:plastocyanin
MSCRLARRQADAREVKFAVLRVTEICGARHHDRGDDTFSQTFTAPGEYDYFCSIHPRMVGKIVVKPAGGSS